MYTGIYFADELAKQQNTVDQLLDGVFVFDDLTAFIDGRHLPCPMPLLKTKVALKAISTGSLYVVATDANAVHDLVAFCQKNRLDCQSWQSTSINQAQHDNAQTDTIFHFYITKKASV